MRHLTKTKLLLTLLTTSHLASCVDNYNGTSATTNTSLKTTVDNHLNTELTIIKGVEQVLLQFYYDSTLSFNGQTTKIDTNNAPIVTVTHEDGRSNLIIDFGEGKTLNGITYKGKIEGLLQGSWWIKGSELTLNFVNYQIDDTKIEGRIGLSSYGVNKNNYSSYSFGIENIDLITTFNNYRLALDLDVVITIYNKGVWNTPYDDFYTITGINSGISHDEINYTSTVIKPIKKEFSCDRFTSGNILLRKDGDTPVSIDFGNGDCQSATINITGLTD